LCVRVFVGYNLVVTIQLICNDLDSLLVSENTSINFQYILLPRSSVILLLPLFTYILALSVSDDGYSTYTSCSRNL